MTFVLLVLIFLAYTTSAYADEVTIGLAGPMSGEMSIFGKEMKEGVDIAVADLNASGGILGKKVVITEQDDACDTKKAHEAAARLAHDKVAAVIGHWCAATSLIASPIYAKEHILQLETGSTYRPLSEDHRTDLFRVSATDKSFARAMSLYVIRHNPNSRVAVVFDGRPPTKEMSLALEDYLKNSPVDIVVAESIKEGTKDFSHLISQLKDAQPDVVACSCYTPEAAHLLVQMKEKKLDAFFYGTNRVDVPEFLALAGKGNVSKVVAIDYARPSQQNYLFRHLNQALWNRQSVVSPETVIAFASVELYAEAVRKADSFDSGKVAEVLHRDIFPTALGNVQFMKNGDRLEPEFGAYQWVGGVPQMKEVIGPQRP